MSESIFNFVRCQWCGGNAGSPSHQCTEEGKRAAEEYAAKEVALMIKAAELQERVDGLTGRQSTSTTNSQLTRLLMECEEALRTTETRAEKAEAERDALVNFIEWADPLRVQWQASLRNATRTQAEALTGIDRPITTVDEDGRVWRVEPITVPDWDLPLWLFDETEDGAT